MGERDIVLERLEALLKKKDEEIAILKQKLEELSNVVQDGAYDDYVSEEEVEDRGDAHPIGIDGFSESDASESDAEIDILKIPETEEEQSMRGDVSEEQGVDNSDTEDILRKLDDIDVLKDDIDSLKLGVKQLTKTVEGLIHDMMDLKMAMRGRFPPSSKTGPLEGFEKLGLDGARAPRDRHKVEDDEKKIAERKPRTSSDDILMY